MNPYKVGTRVIVNISDAFKPHGTIIYCDGLRCVAVVKYENGNYCNNICRFSELTPVEDR